MIFRKSKRHAAASICLLAVLTAVHCVSLTSAEETEKEDGAQETYYDLSGTGKENGEDSDAETEQPESDECNIEFPIDTEDETGVRSLTEEELAQLSEYFSSREHSGFLTCSYDRPEDIDPSKLFYNGLWTGAYTLVMQSPSDEELAVYDEQVGRKGLDMLYYTGETLSGFLKAHTGVTLEELTNPLSEKWFYNADYDSYIWERGDAIGSTWTCRSGQLEDGKKCVAAYSYDDDEDIFGEVTLEKNDDGSWYFVSVVELQ